MTLKLGQLLIADKLLTNEQLEMALESQRLYGGKLGTNLVELGFLKDTDLARFLAKQLQMEAAAPEEFEKIPKSVLDLIPRDFLEQYRLIPLKLDQRLRIAISDAHDLGALDQLRFKIGKSIQAVIAPEIWIIAALERYYQIHRPIRFVQLNKSEESAFEVVRLSDEIKPDLPSPVAQTTIIPFQDYSNRLIKAETKEEVVHTLIEHLSPLFPRIAVFVVRKPIIRGWIVRGFPIHSKQFSETTIDIPSHPIFGKVIETNSAYRGSLPLELTGNLVSLELTPKKEIEIHPVSIREKVVALLMGIPGQAQEVTKPEAANLITLMCEKAGFAFEILSLRQQILKSMTATS